MTGSKKYSKGIAISASLAVLIGAAFLPSLWTETKTSSPHYVDLACAACHDYVQSRCDSADCTACHPTDNPSPYKHLKAPEIDLCTSCHEQEGSVEIFNDNGVPVTVDLGRSHPWGMVPIKHRPRTLPLKHGRVTCHTCHDVHLNNEASHMLRMFAPMGDPDDPSRADFTLLCLDCHSGY